MTNQHEYSRDGNLHDDITPERLEGVRTRRVLAFLIDYFIVGCLVLLAIIPVFILGILTLGLAWLLYPVLGGLIALIYVALTMGGQRQATLGMDFFSLRIEMLDGRRVDSITAIVHAVIFWFAHIVFTPLLLIISLFSRRKRLIQDILLGTVILRSDRP
jgi:uncharacterized RDD family membrane protein YckC